MFKCGTRTGDDCAFNCQQNNMDVGDGYDGVKFTQEHAYPLPNTCASNLASGKKTCEKDYCKTCPEPGECDIECGFCTQTLLGQYRLRLSVCGA